MTMSAARTDFARESARYLREVYLPRMERALAALPAGDLWWRPHEKCLSVGNILLHLEGNVRQWILSGLGGQPDRRERAAELAAEGGREAPALFAQLRATVLAAADLVARFDAEKLAAVFRIQGGETTGEAAIYHVVEHFAWHTGQAVWIAKARAGPGHGVAFHDDARANAARNG